MTQKQSHFWLLWSDLILQTEKLIEQTKGCKNRIAGRSGMEPTQVDEPAFLPRQLAQMRYQDEYAWLVLVSALDIMLTWVILMLPGGGEANAIASYVIERYSLWGMIIYKFSLVVLVIVLCEVIGRRNDRAG